jgi:hypothetical protein
VESIEIDEPGWLVIRTDSKDPEAILKRLADTDTLLGRRIYLKNAKGLISEIVHENGKFVKLKRIPKPKSP